MEFWQVAARLYAAELEWRREGRDRPRVVYLGEMEMKALENTHHLIRSRPELTPFLDTPETKAPEEVRETFLGMEIVRVKRSSYVAVGN